MFWEQLFLTAGFVGVGLTAFPGRGLGRLSLGLIRWQLRVSLIMVAVVGVAMTLRPESVAGLTSLVRDGARRLAEEPLPISPGRLWLGAAVAVSGLVVPFIAAADILARLVERKPSRTLGEKLYGEQPSRRPQPPRRVPEEVAKSTLAGMVPSPTPQRRSATLGELLVPRKVPRPHSPREES